MGLKDLAKLIKKQEEGKSLTDKFKYAYYKTVLGENKKHTPKENMFSPSSLNKCEREIYYRIMAYEPEPRTTPIYLLGSWTAIMETGTDRHERIQKTINNMNKYNIDLEWLDVGEYIKEKDIGDIEIIEQKGMETKLFSKKLSARFLCDGLVKYDDKLYIVEIKTMNNRKWQKAKKRNDINPEHVMQGTAYSLALGVDDVLYIYENRNNNQLLVFHKKVNDEMKQGVMDRIHRIQKYKEMGKIPPKTTDVSKCTFCDYKHRCEMDGPTKPLFGEWDDE